MPCSSNKIILFLFIIKFLIYQIFESSPSHIIVSSLTSVVQQTIISRKEHHKKYIQYVSKKIKELFRKQTCMFFFPLHSLICYCILYNTILDGKEFDLETLMLQLKVENISIFLVCSKFLVMK